MKKLLLLLTVTLAVSQIPPASKIFQNVYSSAKDAVNQRLPHRDVSQPTQRPCIIRETGKNGEKVCVCNSTYCDNIPRPKVVPAPQYLTYTSSKDGLRFHQGRGRFVNGKGVKGLIKIYVNHTQTYQTILGFGGAFTDAAGININSLPPAAQESLLDSYFADDGIKYNFCRVPIGCTDFSTRPYTYDDSEQPDPYLTNFNLTKEDYVYKINYILQAKLRNRELKIFGSPWTPPKWMKTKNDYSGGFVKPEFYQSWADYFLRFIEAYMAAGVSVWGITTQNEPTFASHNPFPLPTAEWNATEIGKFIKHNLGPTIRNSEFQHVKIITMDDQLNRLPWFPRAIMRDNETRNYVDAIATHWYYTNSTSPRAMLETHLDFPEKMLMSTEACSGFQHSDGVDLGSWLHGEHYGIDIITDLLVWYCAWVDWNMALNLQGGPSYINNYVDSPIIVNASSGEFYKQPMYYVLGHFSKFLPPGSIRIKSKHDFDEKLSVVVFTVPDNGNDIIDDDGATVVIILNTDDEDKKLALIDDLLGTAVLQIPKRSITTVLYWPPSDSGACSN